MGARQSTQATGLEEPQEDPNSLTKPQVAGLQHWSLHSRKPEELSKQRVGPTEWNITPFSKSVTSPWDVNIPAAELPKLLNGFRPQFMEHKWFVYADGPDAVGHASLHIFRSWTGHKMAEVKIKVSVDEEGTVGDAKMIEIIWEADEERIRAQTEAGAKSMVLSVCNWVLRARLGQEDSDSE